MVGVVFFVVTVSFLSLRADGRGTHRGLARHVTKDGALAKLGGNIFYPKVDLGRGGLQPPDRDRPDQIVTEPNNDRPKITEEDLARLFRQTPEFLDRLKEVRARTPRN